MQIDWTSRGTTLDDALRGRIQRHLDKLDRLLDGTTEGHVVATAEGSEGNERQVIELIVRSRFGTFASKHSADSADAAVSDAIRAVETQAHRAHDKLIESRRRAAAVDVHAD